MSLTERPVNNDLRDMLINNEAYQYAHLVKFERPSRPDSLSGLTSTAKQRYTYLTDASINVSFDDGTTDLNGTANGTQTYLANKLYKVGAIQEQTKASASQTSISLGGSALGASVTGTASITEAGTGYWDIVFAAPLSIEDILLEGFREGDKVKVNSVPVNIHSFRANNTLRVAKVDTDLTPTASASITMTLASEEIMMTMRHSSTEKYLSIEPTSVMDRWWVLLYQSLRALFIMYPLKIMKEKLK